MHSACRRSIQHIDQTALRKLYEGHIVENRACVFVHDEDFLVDAREELFFAIFAIVFQELHQLRLIDYVEKGYLILIFDLFGDLDRVILA